MNELDELWSTKLANAIENARSSGQDGMADYIALKIANDAVRQAETDKLFQMFIDAGLSYENANKNIAVEREAPHSFVHRNATMKGALLRLSRGVRTLTLEAGWARTPSDGFMRLGALVFARITHFGMPEKDDELVLQYNDETTLWLVVRLGKPADAFGEKEVNRHIDVFLDDRLR